MQDEPQCSICRRMILPVTAQLTNGLCRPCEKKQKHLAAQQQRLDDDDVQLTKSKAHPIARELMREPFLWSTADDDSPLGSDTGADTYAFYREWRELRADGDVLVFLRQLLRQFSVPRENCWDIDDLEVKTALELDPQGVLIQDDTVIAVAFAELVVRGHLDLFLRNRALKAIRRQQSVELISFRGWIDPAERNRRLSAMYTVLELAPVGRVIERNV